MVSQFSSYYLARGLEKWPPMVGHFSSKKIGFTVCQAKFGSRAIQRSWSVICRVKTWLFGTIGTTLKNERRLMNFAIEWTKIHKTSFIREEFVISCSKRWCKKQVKRVKFQQPCSSSFNTKSTCSSPHTNGKEGGESVRNGEDWGETHWVETENRS